MSLWRDNDIQEAWLLFSGRGTYVLPKRKPEGHTEHLLYLSVPSAKAWRAVNDQAAKWHLTSSSSTFSFSFGFSFSLCFQHYNQPARGCLLFAGVVNV